jgi:hypothetical protein
LADELLGLTLVEVEIGDADVGTALLVISLETVIAVVESVIGAEDKAIESLWCRTIDGVALLVEVEGIAGVPVALVISVTEAEEGVTASDVGVGVGVVDDAYTTMGIVRSSLDVDADSIVVCVKYNEDDEADEVSMAIEEESSHDGVTGMTVKIPSFSSTVGDEVEPACTSSEKATGIEMRDLAMGPAEQPHAKATRVR